MYFHRHPMRSGAADQVHLPDRGDVRAVAAACHPIAPIAPIATTDHPAIIGYFSDKNSHLQLDWIEALLPGAMAGPISESYIAPIACRDFRIFVVCGTDCSRMVKLLRHYHNLIGRKLNIALMQRSSPTDRARLLTAGYDDVFDLRTTRSEALSRISAHLRRMDLAGAATATEGPTELDRALDREPILASPCTARERLILAVLYDRRNAVTPNHVIHRHIRRRFGHSNQASLHVVICHIRKKLARGYAITFNPAGGYMLTDPAHTDPADLARTAPGGNGRRGPASRAAQPGPRVARPGARAA